MFIAALFTTAKKGSNLNVLSTEQWIQKVWYIHTEEYHSAIKKNKTMAFLATWWKKSYDQPRQHIQKQRHYFANKGPSSQFSSVAQSCPTLCNPMNHSTPGLPVHHQLLEFSQTHVHRVSDAIQPSHPLWSLSPPAPNPSQHQSLFQWVNSSHEVAKVLEFPL